MAGHPLLRRILRAGVLAAALAGCGATTAPVDVVGVGTIAPTTTTTSAPRTPPPVLRAEVAQDVVARYDVRDGDLAALVSGRDEARHRERFERFETLLPLDVRQRVVGYVVFSSDDDSVAFVSAADDENETWFLGLSDDPADDSELDSTLLHESAHIVTLNETQLDTSWFGACDTYESVDGCLHDDAMLLAWVDRFWRDLLPEWSEIEQTRGPRIVGLIERFFRRHRDRFVRPYAATSPEEDLAETFAAWALGRGARTEAIEEKFAFFESYADFQAARERAQEAGAH
jgi:hypothetical protein